MYLLDENNEEMIMTRTLSAQVTIVIALVIIGTFCTIAPVNAVPPTQVGYIFHGDGGALLDGPAVLDVSGNYAYVPSWRSNALEIVDVSNPAAPVHTGSIKDGAGGLSLKLPKVSMFPVIMRM